ncbi:MAG: hypothetical protein JNL69_03390 [Bacteroidia bacterium]|nr:hypothetical protein [Bacteroidia bacterium]
MKTKLNLFAKVALALILFTGTAFTLSVNNVSVVSEAKAAVSEQDVYNYLICRGYQVITLNPLVGSKFNWVAHTVKNDIHYTTTIYCNSEIVIGHEDIQL